MMKSKIQHMILLSLLASLAAVLSIFESMIPIPVPIPGVKIGLANVISMIVLYRFGVKSTIWVILMRTFIAFLFSGSFFGFCYSIIGSIFSLITMFLIRLIAPNFRIWIVSVFGALSHVFGQILFAMFLMQSKELIWYFPPLAAISIVSGTVTGMIVMIILQRSRIFFEKKPKKT